MVRHDDVGLLARLGFRSSQSVRVPRQRARLGATGAASSPGATPATGAAAAPDAAAAQRLAAEDEARLDASEAKSSRTQTLESMRPTPLAAVNPELHAAIQAYLAGDDAALPEHRMLDLTQGRATDDFGADPRNAEPRERRSGRDGRESRGTEDDSALGERRTSAARPG